MKTLAILFISTIYFTLVGCSTTYKVTLDSVPQGATVVCDKNNLGMTPTTFSMPEKKYKEIVPNLNLCSANWVSGESKNFTSASVSNNPNGIKQTVIRSRGKGYTKDAEFALKVQNMKSQKRQAAAAESSVYQQRRAARAAEKQNNKTTTCYTNFGVTTCY